MNEFNRPQALPIDMQIKSGLAVIEVEKARRSQLGDNPITTIRFYLEASVVFVRLSERERAL